MMLGSWKRNSNRRKGNVRKRRREGEEQRLMRALKETDKWLCGIKLSLIRRKDQDEVWWMLI